MSRDSRNLILSMLLVLLLFAFPYRGAQHNNPVFILLAGGGILLARMMILSSKNQDRTGIEPSVLAFIAAWGCGYPLYLVVAALAAAGSLINSIRAERPVRQSLTAALYQGVSFAFLLRLGAFLFPMFVSLWNTPGAVGTYASLAMTSIVLTLLRTLSVNLTGERGSSPGTNLRRNLFSNTFILLIAVPGTMAASVHPCSAPGQVPVAVSLFAMLAVHGISIGLNRSTHERTEELETVLKLKELSQKLFSAENEGEVLRTLCGSLSGAWRCASAAKWRNVTWCEGEPWNTAEGVSFAHPDGLTVFVDSINSTVPEYLESFAERTVPVLLGLEAEKRMENASWKSVETMVSFLEGNESEFAGFSRMVASTADELSSALGMNRWFADCLRLAGLLHTISLADGSEESPEQTLALPEVTQTALNHMDEHWCGTGPGMLKESSIPLPARILAVSIGWERAKLSGVRVAGRDLKMKAGTIYDPRLVEKLLELNS